MKHSIMPLRQILDEKFMLEGRLYAAGFSVFPVSSAYWFSAQIIRVQ